MVQIKKNPDNLELSNLAGDRGLVIYCIETYHLKLLVTYKSNEPWPGIHIEIHA